MTAEDPREAWRKIDEDEETVTYLARSKTAPATEHVVLLAKATGIFSCTCEGYRFRHRCRHIPGWPSPEPGTEGADHLRREAPQSRPREGSRTRTSTSSVPPLPKYHDVIESWENTLAVCRELFNLDASFREAVLERNSTKILLRLWEIEFNVKIVLPPGYARDDFVRQAPTPASVIRQTLDIAKFDDAGEPRPEYVPRIAGQEMRKEIVAEVVKSQDPLRRPDGNGQVTFANGEAT